VIHDVAKQLFHEVINEMSVQLSTATVSMFLQQTEYICDELISDLVSYFIRSDLPSIIRSSPER